MTLVQYDINLREYWRILKKRKAIVAVTAIILGFFSTSFAILRAPTPIYQSVSSIKFDKETAVEGLYAKTLSWSDSDDMETQISIIKSYAVFEKVAQNMGLIPNKAIKEGHLKSDIIRIIIGLQSKVKVTREKFTNILNIQVEDEKASFAQKLANTIALTYKELHAERQMKRTLEALKYIKDQLEEVQRKLKESEDAFNRFTQDNQLISIDLQSENLLVKSQGTQDELRKIQKYKKDLDNLSERITQFIKDPSGSSNEFYSEKINNRYQTASAALMELQLKKETLLEDYTPQHPEVIAISRNIIENARKMLILLRVEIRDSELKENDLLKELRNIRNKTDLLMERKIEYDRRKRRVEYYRNMTALLEEKYQEALIRKAEKPEEITIVRPALLQMEPINPPKTATSGVIGVIIGLILGLVAALVVETFDTSLGAIEDVEQTIGAPVLGVIPFLDSKQLHQSLREKFPDGVDDLPSIIKSPHIISHFAPMSVISESFRALRTGIQFKEADQPIKSITVTSASPQEGKTFVALNFSITMAQAGMKVLLVGADMRKPMLSKALGLESTPGLSDILLGSYTWTHSIKTISDIIMGKIGLDGAMITPGLDNLHLITSGAIPPNPAELIESKGTLDFMKAAEDVYDIVIFDAPPILSTADAAIISSRTDGVLLVYRVGAVSRGLLNRSATQLQQAKSKILGVVLNGVRPEISPDFYDFRYNKYDYANGSHAEEKKRHKLFKGRGDRSEDTERLSDKREGKTLTTGTEKEGAGRWKMTTGVAAVVFLGLGLLWQNGFVASFKSQDVEKPIFRAHIEPVNTKKTKGTVENKRKKNGSNPVSHSIPPTKMQSTVISQRGQTRPKKPFPKKTFEKLPKTAVKDFRRTDSAGHAALPPNVLFEEDGKAPQDKPEVSSWKKGLAGPQKHPAAEADQASGTQVKFPSRTNHEAAAEAGRHIEKPKGKNSLQASVETKKVQIKAREEILSPAKETLMSSGREAGGKVMVKSLYKSSSPLMIVAKTKKKRVKNRIWNIHQITLISTADGPDEEDRQEANGIYEASVMPESPDHKNSYPYSLYLGSFKSEERAKRAMALYKSNGFVPYRVRVEFKEIGVWFRIYGGYFKDIEEADGFRKRYQLWEAEIRRTKYANLLGVYTNDKALEDKISSLENMGLSPYVIPENNGKSSLFLGAYVTLEGAEQQHQKLMNQGIAVQVVKR